MLEYLYNNDFSQIVYYIFHVFGFIGVFVFNYFNSSNYSIKKAHSCVITACVYSIMYIWIYILFWIESGFSEFGGNNIVRGFVYIPLIAYPFGRLFKINLLTLCDFIAPCICLCQAISHVGCIFTGCCRGFENDWGIYNPALKIITFPSQLIESIIALIIFIVVIRYAKFKAYDLSGKSFALMLVLFGITRFICEFARVNNKILIGCSSLAFHALFMAIVGAIMMISLNYKKNIKVVRKRRK